MKILLTTLLILIFFSCGDEHDKNYPRNDTTQKEREHDEVLDAVSDWTYSKCNEYFDKAIFLANASGNRDSIDKYNYLGRAMREVFMKVISLKYRNKKKPLPPKPSPLPDTIKKFYDTAGVPIMIIDGRETCYLYCLGENQKLALYYYCMATVAPPKPTPLPDTTKPLKSKWLDIDISESRIVTYTPEPIYETIKVLLHCINEKTQKEFFVRGHEVIEKTESGYRTLDKDGGDWTGQQLATGVIYHTEIQYTTRHFKYLDSKHNAIDNNITVWDSRPIKSPNPSPLPDTTKPLKIKMQPRWRGDDTIYVQSIPYYINDSTFLIDTSGTGYVTGEQYKYWMSKVDSAYYPKKDTSKVLLLVSDTSSENGFRSSRCFWMYGYRVRGEDILEEWGGYIYLDDRRLPIPKNIVVFLSKELK